jgi:hypothetical protein
MPKLYFDRKTARDEADTHIFFFFSFFFFFLLLQALNFL